MPSTSVLSSLEPLVALCQSEALPLDELAISRFERYLALLLRFSRSMNLIGPMAPKDVVRELLCDSVLAAVARAPEGAILDVGSGAGLPGLPLKILYPQHPLTLVEPRRKRASFLQIATRKLKLKQVEVLHTRLEHASDLGHDYVISKAFQPPQVWLETALKLIRPGGVIVCMTRELEQPALDERAGALGLARLSAHSSQLSTHEGVVDRAVYVYERSL